MSLARDMIILTLLILSSNILAQSPNLVSMKQTVVSSNYKPSTTNSSS